MDMFDAAREILAVAYDRHVVAGLSNEQALKAARAIWEACNEHGPDLWPMHPGERSLAGDAIG